MILKEKKAIAHLNENEFLLRGIYLTYVRGSDHLLDTFDQKLQGLSR